MTKTLSSLFVAPLDVFNHRAIKSPVISFDFCSHLRQLHSGKKPATIMTLSMKVSVNFSKVLWMMRVRSFRSDFQCQDTSRPSMAALRYHSYSLMFSEFS